MSKSSKSNHDILSSYLFAFSLVSKQIKFKKKLNDSTLPRKNSVLYFVLTAVQSTLSKKYCTVYKTIANDSIEII